MTFRGIIPVVLTWFTDRDELDLETQATHLDFLIKAGADSLFIQGSASEFAYLTLEERSRQMRFVCDHVSGRCPVLVGVSANTTAETVELTRQAEACWADGIVAVAPYYWVLGREPLIEHFRQIGQSTSLPMLAYNFPALTGHDLTAPLVKTMVQEIPNLTGIKDTVDSLRHIREIVQTVKAYRPDFTVLAGYDEYLLPTLASGGDGIIGATANFAPQVTISLYQAYRNQDFGQVMARHGQVSKLMELFTLATPPVAAIKEAALLAGIPGTVRVRPPLPALGPKQREAVKRLVQDVVD